ncbi:hypothetical protein Chor_010362 [Crotalus horridus]
MSTFGGVMREYPHLSIDRFDRENLRARAYFLSHCHKDHMKGLRAPSMKRRLACSLKLRLYCSPVTKELLLSSPRYTFWENYIVTLEVETPTQISLIEEATGEKEDIEVTLLPAGHCPGSVMFLFQGENGTVLYTGDFRLARGEVARMELLHSGSRLPNIVHVNKLDMFKNMPEILYHVTTNRHTQIHACRHPRSSRCAFSYGPEGDITIPSEGQGVQEDGSEEMNLMYALCLGPERVPTELAFHFTLLIARKLARLNEGFEQPRLDGGGSDDEDLFDSERIPHKNKIPKLLPETGPTESKLLPPNPEDNSCKAAPIPTSLQVDFVECDESNGEDEEEEEEEGHEKETALPEIPLLRTDSIAALRHPNSLVGSTGKPNEDQQQANLEVPKWDSFFRRPSEDPETSDHEDHQPCTDSTEQHSPCPYDDDDDLSDSTHISSQNSSQSTHISEQGSQGWDSQADTVLVSSQERRNFEFSPSKGGAERRTTHVPHLLAKKTDLPNSQPLDRGAPSADPLECKVRYWGTAAPGQTEPLDERTKPEGRPETLNPEVQIDSQGSSDFEVPPTPGAEIPKPDQLSSLYQKLAAGENFH